MMRKLIVFAFLIISFGSFAQYKTDVLVIGGSAAGSAAAMQAARSGVKAILVEPSSALIGDRIPALDIAAFNTGIWKEWKDNHKKAVDSLATTDPRLTLESIIYKVKGLQLLKNAQIVKIKKKRKGWEVSISRNNKTEKIKAKVLVDAFYNENNSPIFKSKIINFTDNKMVGLVSFTPQHLKSPYSQQLKLYRTSGATGFGKDTLAINYFPIGAFISKEQENLIIISPQADLRGFSTDDFANIATWMNIGQMAGAVAAYGPFFNTTPSKANVRLTQGEVFNYKSIIYPVLDIKQTEYAWYAVQKIIASELLSLDFSTGKFNPEKVVNAESIKPILSNLYPRSRIWFIENKATDLKLSEAISLMSFIGGREIYDIEKELKANWTEKYKLASTFNPDKLVTKKEFAIIADLYLNPYSINVDMQGLFIK